VADDRHAEAVDIMARKEAADAIKFAVHLYRVRKIPVVLAREIDAQVKRIEAGIRPDLDVYEAAFDSLIHKVDP
jgi:hypothetical protein